MAFFCGTLYLANNGKQEELDRELKEIEELKEKIAEQEDRTLELEELSVYVKTMKYVEEQARNLGLVYPDEITYKPK